MKLWIPILLVALVVAGCTQAKHASKTQSKAPSTTAPADSSAAASASIDWLYDLDTAAAAAKKTNKPIMVDFYTDWCHWCKKLDENTYTDKDVAELSKKFVCVKVDGDKYPDIVDKYQVEGFPTIVFLNSDAKEVKRIPGYEETQQFLKDMQDALDKAK